MGIEAYAASSSECYYRPEVSGTLEQLEDFFSDQVGDEWGDLRAEMKRQLGVAMNISALATKNPYEMSVTQRCGVYGNSVGLALMFSVAVLKPDRVIVAESERLTKGGARLGSGPPLRSSPTPEPSTGISTDVVPAAPAESPEVDLTCPERSDFARTSRSAQQFVDALQNTHPNLAEVSTAMDLWSAVLVAHHCRIPAKRGSFFELPSQFRGLWSTSAEGGKCGKGSDTFITDDTLMMKDKSRCGVAHNFSTSQSDALEVVLFCADKKHLFNLNGRWSINSAQDHRTFSEQYLPEGNLTTADECSG